MDQDLSGIRKSYQRTVRAIEYLNELNHLYERQAEIYGRILCDVQNGDLPEEFAELEFDKLWDLDSQRQTNPKKPDELRLPIYQEMKLADIILLIFDRAEQEAENYRQNVFFSVDELTRLIYLTETKEEVNACKGSLTAALNRCVKDRELTRIKPGVFARNPKKRDQTLLFLYKQEGQSHAI